MKLYVFNLFEGYGAIFELVGADSLEEAKELLRDEVRTRWNYLINDMKKKQGENWSVDTENLYYRWMVNDLQAIDAAGNFIGEMPMEKGVLNRKYNVDVLSIE